MAALACVLIGGPSALVQTAAGVALQGEPTCPCTIWAPAAVPPVADDDDPASVEVGTRFRSDIAGYVTGIRFYKAPLNTGTHVGRLWSQAGTLLAAVTFTNETASGWQQATFATAVPIAAHTTYVVSYHAPEGHYTGTDGFFTSALDRPPLHGLLDGVDGANGVYRYGDGGVFPTDTYESEGYWADVVFDTGSSGTLSIADTTVTEGQTGSVTASLAVTLSSISAQTVTVAYATANGTATAGIDYTAASGTLTFLPGVTSQPIAIAVTGDTTAEPHETVLVTLTAPVNATVLDGQGVVTILDDDTPMAGLVAAYGFSEGSGTTTADASGAGHSGSIAGATWTTQGRHGTALSFDGVNDLVTIADTAALDVTRTTVMAWVRPTVLSGWRTAVLKESAEGLAYALYAHDDEPRPAGYVNIGGDHRTVDGTAALPLDAWTHLALTYDGAALRLYVNGILDQARAQTGDMAPSAQALYIGGNSLWGEWFAGVIDDVRIYNRALTLGEVQTSMTMAVTLASTTLTPPAITPPAGAYEGLVTVAVSSAQPGVTIRYTTDGTVPSATSPIYTGPIAIDVTTTVRAIALHPEMTTSAEASGVYTMIARTPTLSVPSGTYAPGSVVTIASPDAAATLRLTLDGTDPTAGSPVVASGTSLLIGGFTLKVRAFKAGTTDSAFASGAYALTTALGAGALAAGDAHTVLASPDGLVYAWGLNGTGQLGDGSVTTRLVPTLVPTLTGVTSVAAGQAHTLARTWDGQVYAWGANDAGQVGDGTTDGRSRPVHVSALTNVVAVAAGDRHSLALTSDGRVLAWGRGDSGQLGLGSTLSQAIPTEVPGVSPVVAIAAGDGYSLAVTAAGQLYAWGDNAASTLGDGTTTMRTSPVLVGLANVASVSAGATHALALLRGGAVYAWGLGTSGQLGLGATTLVTTPTLVPGVTASAIAASGDHSAAVRGDGVLVAWGANASGQVGDGSTTNRSVPTVIAGAGSVSALALGAAHTITVASDGTVSAWGEASSGQLGDGGTTDRLTPVAVMATSATWAPAAPQLSLASGTFSVAQVVTITSAFPGAIVRYTLTGTDPIETDQAVPATGVIDIVESVQLRARVFVAGRLPGAIARADYTLQVAAPVITPATGTYTSAQTVTLTSSDAAATLRYTLDGTDPTAASTLYSGAWVANTAVTITARAFRAGWLASEPAQVVLQINAIQTAPVASPAPGVYPDPVAVALSFLPDTTIRYTLDGSVPSAVSNVYVTPLPVTSGAATIKAIAFRTDGTASEVLTASYTIDTVAPTITAVVSPAAVNGWHNAPVTVTFTCQDVVGVASCPAPVTISADGVGLLGSGTAVDRAGRQASVSVTVNLDRTPPVVTLATPADGLVTPATTVTMSGQVTDLLSGLTVVRCNGVTASVVGDEVSCSAPLRPGRNAVVLTAHDAAGNTTSAGVTVTHVGTVTRLTLTPDTRTMLVEETGTLSLRDDFGAVVTGATWTSTNSSRVSLSGDDPPVLTALAAGQATIFAQKNGLSSAATITVVVGTTLSDGTTGLPDGTTRWTVAPAPDVPFSLAAPIYTHRIDASGPDVFMVEVHDNWERTVRAITATGEVQWLATAPGVPLMGDMFGGIVGGVEPAPNTCLAPSGEVERCYTALTRFAGPAGTASWRYDSPGLVDRPAQGRDGTIYVLEHTGDYLYYPNPPGLSHPGYKSVVILDGATGRVTARVPLNATDHEPVTVGPIVGGDGFGYILVTHGTQITLRRLSREGQVASEVIVPSRQCPGLSCSPPRPMQLVPDGIGGLMIRAMWYLTNDLVEFRATRLDGLGGRVDTVVPSNMRIDLIGQAGRAFLWTPTGTQAVDVRALTTPLWTLPPAWALLAASPEGGAAAVGAAGEVGLFNAQGQLISTTLFGLENPVYALGGLVGNSGRLPNTAAGLRHVVSTFSNATRYNVTRSKVLWNTPEQYGFGEEQGTQSQRNPGMGIFAKAHNVAGLAPQRHIAIWMAIPAYSKRGDLDSFVGNDLNGNRVLTLGAESQGGGVCGGLLVSSLNRAADQTLHPEFLEQLRYTPSLEDELITRLLATDARYLDNAPYNCFPDENPGTYNSNSFAAGLLDAAGMSRPENPTNLPLALTRQAYPGWLKPLPVPFFNP